MVHASTTSLPTGRTGAGGGAADAQPAIRAAAASKGCRALPFIAGPFVGRLRHPATDAGGGDDDVVVEDDLCFRRGGRQGVDLVVRVEGDALEQHVGAGAKIEPVEALLVHEVLAPAVEVVS